MIELTKDLDKEDCLNLFLYYNFKILGKKIHFIDEEVYNKFIIDEKLIEKYNQDYLEFYPTIKKWKKDYVKVKNFFLENPKIKIKVINWNDREKTEYFKEKLQQGYEYEEKIKKFFRERYDINIEIYKTKKEQYECGECIQGIEIKNDTRYSETNNLYIEVYEKSNRNLENWTESGILKNDKSKYFLIGDNERFWIFRKSKLKEIYREKKYRIVKTLTSIGMLIPCKEANELEENIKNVVKEIKENTI